MNSKLKKAHELANIAPRCFYSYDPIAGSRPCTIDMERYHHSHFKLLDLPGCPFVNDCFTRSDCLYITGDCTDAEGSKIVQANLRVDKLTTENTTSTWPYK